VRIKNPYLCMFSPVALKNQPVKACLLFHLQGVTVGKLYFYPPFHVDVPVTRLNKRGNRNKNTP